MLNNNCRVAKAVVQKLPDTDACMLLARVINLEDLLVLTADKLSDTIEALDDHVEHEFDFPPGLYAEVTRINKGRTE